jgi:hypothetical protein
MKFIIKENILMNAHTAWAERMGLITPEEFAEQIEGQLVTVPNTHNPDDISIDCFSKNSSGVYSFSQSLYNDHINSKKMDYIRKKRVFECFRIVNRGQMWHNNLTQSQRDEVQAWYNAWLELPNRADLNIDSPQYPVVPSFISDFISYEDISPKQ